MVVGVVSARPIYAVGISSAGQGRAMVRMFSTDSAVCVRLAILTHTHWQNQTLGSKLGINDGSKESPLP
jgi:hypothetical protein